MTEAQDPGVWLQIGQFLVATFGPGGFVLAAACGFFAWAGMKLHKNCRDDMSGVWARVTAISEARSADAKEMAKAVSENTIALARVAERVDISDRRTR